MALLDSLFGKKKSNKFVGVDIGSSSIKVVQLSKSKGKVSLDTFGEISLGPYAQKAAGKSVQLDSMKLTEGLKDLLRESQVDAKSAGFSIPLKSSLVFNMKMPEVSDSKLDEMVRLEARRYIPVPINEVSLDWSVIPDDLDQDDESVTAEDDRKFLNIMVVAIHKDTLQKYKEVSDNAELDIQFLEIETFSTIRSVLSHDNGVVAIMDIGASVTKVYIVEYGVVQKSHVVGVGSQNMLQALETQRRLSAINEDLNLRHGDALKEQMNKRLQTPIDLDRILVEANKVILDFQKKHRKNIEQVILTGGGSILKGIMPYVQKSIESEITIAHPFSKVETPAFLENTLRDAGPEFSVAIGLALRGLR